MLNILMRNVMVRSVIAAVIFLAWAGAGVVNVETVSVKRANAIGGTFIVGDSTTWRLTGEYDNTANWWALRHPDWTVDGVGGRNVVSLPDRILWHLNNVDSSPSLFVMALGTNPAPDGHTWWKSDYNQALNLLPATTKVVLVIPVRASRIGVDQRVKSEDVTRYAGYLRELAQERNKTIAAEWRPLVMNDTTRDPVTGEGYWTNDGVHQRNPFGRSKWIDLIDDAIARFN